MLKVTGLTVPMGNAMTEQVGFHLEQGDFFVLFGSGNSGKTEVLNAVLGLEKSYGGTVEFAGKDIHRLSMEERKKIRFVPEKPLVLHGVRAKGYFDSLARNYKVADKGLLNELVEYFGIDEKEYLTKMSFERNKLTCIIGALLTSPQLLILDEPFRFLSEEMSERLLNYLRKQCDEGMTLLLATEHFEDADERANSYLYLRRGKPEKEGRIPADWVPPKKLVIRKADPDRVREVFGEPEGTYRDALVYIRDISWEELGKRISACGIEKNVIVNTARLEEILDVENPLKEEAPEEPKKKRGWWRRKKESEPVVKEEKTLEAEETKEPVQQEPNMVEDTKEIAESAVAENTIEENTIEESAIAESEIEENETEDRESRENREETLEEEGGQEA